MHSSILVFRNFRYLKLSAVLVVVSLIAFFLHEPLGQPNGGTWLGYTLGGVSLFIILLLTWYGIRKRSYGKGKLLLEDWASAHVYLGMSLLVLATLHTGFQFGLNVHTLAYALMLLVISSGLFGLFAYLRYPKLTTQNRGEATVGDVWELVAGMSSDCLSIATDLDDQIYTLVDAADKNTRIGGSLLRQLSGKDPKCASTFALNQIREIAKSYSDKKADNARRLVSLMAKKVELLNRIRKDIQYKALMDIWLYFHIPLTVALLVTLFIHIIVVFLYW